jgi:hypothetical protein
VEHDNPDDPDTRGMSTSEGLGGLVATFEPRIDAGNVSGTELDPMSGGIASEASAPCSIRLYVLDPAPVHASCH